MITFIFYGIYNMMRKGKQDKQSSLVFSLFVLSMLFFFNFILVVNLLKKAEIFYYNFTNEWTVIIPLGLIIGLSALYFFYQKRYDKIINKFENIENNKKNKYLISSIIYVLASLLLFAI